MGLIKEYLEARTRDLAIADYKRELYHSRTNYNCYFANTFAGKMIEKYHGDVGVQCEYLNGIIYMRDLNEHKIAFRLAGMPLIIGDKLSEDFRDALIKDLVDIGKRSSTQLDFEWPVDSLSRTKATNELGIKLCGQAVELVNICAERDMRQAVHIALTRGLELHKELNPLITQTISSEKCMNLIKPRPAGSISGISLEWG